MLLPLLRGHDTPRWGELAQWTQALVSDCHELLSMVLPLADREREFLERLNGKGEIAPEVLTDDDRLQNVVRMHPGLLWKALTSGNTADPIWTTHDRQSMPRSLLASRIGSGREGGSVRWSRAACDSGPYGGCCRTSRRAASWTRRAAGRQPVSVGPAASACTGERPSVRERTVRQSRALGRKATAGAIMS